MEKHTSTSITPLKTALVTTCVVLVCLAFCLGIAHVINNQWACKIALAAYATHDPQTGILLAEVLKINIAILIATALFVTVLTMKSTGWLVPFIIAGFAAFASIGPVERITTIYLMNDRLGNMVRTKTRAETEDLIKNQPEMILLNAKRAPVLVSAISAAALGIRKPGETQEPDVVTTPASKP